MAKNTEISLRNKVIYSVYVRNHTNDGTFNAVAEDLDRIKSLGTDIIWFMPIHPIGVKNKKGSLGCPYANKGLSHNKSGIRNNGRFQEPC